ncbi:MAG: 3-hydroxyacyl-CoA dehydrogenase/enoyl-CoA hydratase family protein [Bacteroidia bacterium]|nr:3-hydroxyacyl-CoA dehydrogenase/enoyl-CoA hydratase family protein [Bacteroidia bacterium]
MNRSIRKVAVLGSGIMGSRIACHFANIGAEVILLDIAPRELTPEEAAKGLSLESPAVRNRIVNSSLDTAVKSNPSPIYSKSVLGKIKTGNFADDLPKIATCDWVIEVIIENLEIKKKLFDDVEKYRKAGSLITSNTSGIPIRMMSEGRSEDFQNNFCGTHFFNPPRYLRLLEIIPGPKTDPAVIEFLMHYGDVFLGKKTVLCKDTPAFIANRVGIYSIMALFHLVKNRDITIEEVDKLTGPIIGRPKSATFRTCDLVGLDTAVKVAKGIFDNCPNDERRELFELPDYISQMVANNMHGDKTGQGFYKKSKGPNGERQILGLDLKTLQYRPEQKSKYPVFDELKKYDDIPGRLKVLAQANDKFGDLFRHSFYGVFAYVSNRIPEIADDLYKIDWGMNAGFGWDLGPFQVWDILGVAETVANMEKEGYIPAPWIKEMLTAGNTSFYKINNGSKQYYDVTSKSYKTIHGSEGFILLDNLRDTNVIWKNVGTSLFDLGDGILNLEFQTKMNSIGAEVIEGVHKAIDLAEKEYRGLVIGNDGVNFSVGANLLMIYMLAVEQDWDELAMAVKTFQNTCMRLRYSSIPVVVAPHGFTFGGGCEMSLHADSIVAAAETYMGLVEFGVGVIPGGGGTKELTLRASDSFFEGDPEFPTLRKQFLTIGTAKVSTSAAEAFDIGFMRSGKDRIILNQERVIAEAKKTALQLAEAGYTQPASRKDIKVLGKSALGMIYAGAYAMFAGNYMSEHDKLIAEKLGWVMCGGDLSSPTLVSEQYLLDLECEAFLSLCGEKKTLERIQYMLQTGKPLRN